MPPRVWTNSDTGTTWAANYPGWIPPAGWGPNWTSDTGQTAEEDRLAAAEEKGAAEDARLAAAEEDRLAGAQAAAAEEARLAQQQAQQEAQQQQAAAQAAREAAAKEARGKVMSIDQRWYGPLEDGTYWQNPNHQDYDASVLTPGESAGTGTGTGTDTSLFGYYRDALNLVSDDGGLAALATPAEAAFRSEGNPFASNTASNTTGNVPNYTYERAQVPGTYEANRRPGSRGQRYFSDAAFVPQGSPQRQTVRNTYANQASDAQLVNRANAAQQRQFDAQPRPTYTQPTATPMNFSAYTPPVNPASEAGTSSPAPTRNDLMAFLAQREKNKEEGGSSDNLPEGATGGPHPHPNMRAGGLARLAAGGPASAYNRRYNGYAMGGIPQAQGHYVGGATDGMADRIPARIDNNQEARLSDGEFVVPADVVSHLGNGNSSAGAKNLYGMMDRVRMARTGNKQQGKQIDPNKFIPNR